MAEQTQDKPSKALAQQLSTASVRMAWDVYSAFDWPETLPTDDWMMSPEIISLYGTPLYEQLSDEQRKRLSVCEIGNFFSLVLQGERPLVQGLVHRLYSPHVSSEVSHYLHHFVDEENKHMVMFGLFCEKYLGKIYPEKKLALPAMKMSRGEEEVTFFCKVLVVEELGDYYNLFMQKDQRLAPIVREVNRVHHIDEARHLAFGRAYLRELCQEHSRNWDAPTRARIEEWLLAYIKSCWSDYTNPTMYKDAGLPNSYQIYVDTMASPICAAHRRRASEKLTNLLVELGLLSEAPGLQWTE